MRIEVRTEEWPFVQMPSRLVTDTGIKDGAKVTYAALMIWGGKDGRAWPSRAILAEARGTTDRSIRRHIGELVDSGWLLREVEGDRTILTVLRTQASGGGGHERPDPLTHVSPEREEGKRSLKEKKTNVGSETFLAAWDLWRKAGGRLLSTKPKTAKAWDKALEFLDTTDGDLYERVRVFTERRSADALPDLATALAGPKKGCQFTDHALESMRRWAPSSVPTTQAPAAIDPTGDRAALAADLLLLYQEADDDRYSGYPRHGEFLASLEQQALAGREITPRQKTTLRGIVDSVARWSRPTQSYNCPPTKWSPRELAVKEAAKRLKETCA